MDNTTNNKYWYLSNAYEIRSVLSAIGGHFCTHSKEWKLTQEQYDRLWEMVNESETRSNKRDRHLFVQFQKVTEEFR